MKYYCQFQRLQNEKWNIKINRFEPCKPELVDRLGTNAIVILDGRKTIYNMVSDCFDVFYYKTKLYSDIQGFKIVQAHNFRIDGTIVYQSEIMDNKSIANN